MFSSSAALATALVLGQAEAPSPDYEHLKRPEYFISDWEQE